MPNNNNDSKNRCQYGKITKDDITALQGAGGAELLIYMSLAIHAWNDDRIAFPTSRTIQELTGLSRSSVKRGLSKLRERKAIIEVGKTNIGSIKYRLGGTTFDTRPKSETRPTFDTPTSPKSETPGVQDMTPIKLKKNNNTQNIKASDADENDVHMFVELWNKWNGHCLCDWESMNPIQEYKSMKAVVLQKWKQHRSNKDLSFELQVCDIYIMQKLVSLGKEFSGPARFWSGSKWSQGLLKWLSSTTPSHMGGNRKDFISHCIKVENAKAPESRNKATETTDTLATYKDNFLQRVMDAKEAHEIHNDNTILIDALQWIHNDMKYNLDADQIEMLRKDKSFADFWNTIGE